MRITIESKKGSAGIAVGFSQRQLCTMKPDTNIQTTLRELPLDKLEKLGEMLAELQSNNEE